MNKKAASVLMMIFEVLAIVIIVSVVFKIASGYAKAETVIKVNLANDLVMMINTLVALPETAMVIYPENVSAYTISLTNENVLVMKKNDAAINRIVRVINLPKTQFEYSASGLVEEKSKICLFKENRNIRLTECPAEYSSQKGALVS